MIEPLLFGIVLGTIPVTIFGLYIAAWLQFSRGNKYAFLQESPRK